MLDYPLDPDGALEDEVRKSLIGLVGEAAGRLERPGKSGVDVAVHESRKRLKEARALLRLVRSSLVDADGNKVRSRANAALRDAARLLAGARDAAVMIDTLDRLRETYADDLAADAFDDLRERLADRHGRLADEAAGDATAEAAKRLRAFLEEVDSWSLKRGDWRAIGPNLRKIYARGHADLGDVRDSADADPAGAGDAETLHEFRKAVKNLRYAYEFLARSAPHAVGGARDAVKELSDLLGDDHDYAELSRVVTDGTVEADPATAEVVAALCRRRRAALQSAALPLASRVYAEKPGAFEKRIGAYWKSATP